MQPGRCVERIAFQVKAVDAKSELALEILALHVGRPNMIAALFNSRISMASSGFLMRRETADGVFEEE